MDPLPPLDRASSFLSLADSAAYYAHVAVAVVAGEDNDSSPPTAAWHYDNAYSEMDFPASTFAAASAHAVMVVPPLLLHVPV